MPLLFSMSFAGSLPLLLCILIILLKKESVNFLLVNGLLKLSIFFFLIPVQLVRLIHPVVPNTITWYLDGKFRFYTKDGLFLLPSYLVLLGVIIICVLFIFCIFETVQYRRALTVLLKASIPLPEVNASEKTSVYLNPTLTTPCTVAFFHCRNFPIQKKTGCLRMKRSIFPAKIHFLSCSVWFAFVCTGIIQSAGYYYHCISIVPNVLLMLP